MIPTLIIATLIIATLILAGTALAKGPSLSVLTSEAIVATWKCSDQLGQPRTKAASPWKPHTAGYRRWQLNVWTLRKKDCLATLAERRRQWDWQAWLPDKWRRIGICETQLNWQHYNSGYQGAFGFATSSWDAFKLDGYPDDANQATPWQQYQVALAIYRRYGLSGWGCRNA